MGNYVQRIYDNWLKTVKPDDTVVLLGDISWAMKLHELDADFHLLIPCRARR